MYLELEDNEQRTTRIMEPGDTAHIKPLVWHRLTALTPAEVIEFSTFHREDDSVFVMDSVCNLLKFLHMVE